MAIKGTPAQTQNDGSDLRIAIVHARWNKPIIDSLLEGALTVLKQRGVKEENIVVQTVPGSFELPFACSRIIAGGRVQSNTTATATDLMSSSTTDLLSGAEAGSSVPSSRPFDAVIAIGVLIKGSTMHFEYICDSVSHGLMKLQLDTGVPVIFGVLTALTDEQALERAGMGTGPAGKGHNHGEDWGSAAVEMSTNTRNWSQGKFS